MIIQACIGDDEFDFELEPEEIIIDGETLIQWNGNVEGAVIQFLDRKSSIDNLQIASEITTSQEVIYERIMDGLNSYYDALRTGVAPETKILVKNKPYNPDKIKVRPLNLSAFEITRYIQKNKIKLKTDFQRNFVWDNTRKSRLIESMLLKIPLPAFYFWENKKGYYEIVDGLQRITVINEFLTNQFKLRNLEYLSDLDGVYYETNEKEKKKGLPEEFSSRVEVTQLNINVIESGSPEKVKYEIFYRINTGGRPLNKQEVRNCFASPELRLFLEEIVNHPSFKKATNESVKDVRMDAQELILRFLAFYQYGDEYKGDKEPFLNDSQEKLNNLKPSEFIPLKNAFVTGMENAHKCFGDYSFRKCLPKHLELKAKKQLVNKSLFLTWSVTLSKIKEESLKNITPGSFALPLARIIEESSKREGDYPEYYKVVTTGTGDKANLDLAFKYAYKFLKEIIGVSN